MLVGACDYLRILGANRECPALNVRFRKRVGSSIAGAVHERRIHMLDAVRLRRIEAQIH